MADLRLLIEVLTKGEGNLKNINRDLSKTGDEAEKTSSKLSNIGKTIGAFATGFVAFKAVEFLGDASQAAAEFNDTLSASGVIFSEDATPALEEWADGAAKAFGASKQQALDAANTFAVFGKSAGLVGDDLTDFSTDLTELAGDLASFRGGTTEDAITAIGAALRGESEPIRRYGVLLDDATLKQRALELGIIDTTKKALTPQQRVLAAQAEIFDQTADAQGDFARTSDDMANVQRALAAELENVSIEIGQEMIPVLVEVARFLRDDGIPAFREFIGMLDGTDTQTAGGFFGAIEQGFETIGGSAVRANDLILGRLHELQDAADEMGISYETLRDRVRTVMDRVGVDHEEAFRRVTGAFEGIETVTTFLPENIKQATAGVVPAIEEGLEGTPEALSGPFEDGSEDAVEEVKNMYSEIAAEMKRREDELRTAGGNAIDAWLDPQLTGFKIAGIESELASQELKDNLASEDENIRRDAEERTLVLTAELIKYKNEAALQGDLTAQISKTAALLTSDNMLTGLMSKDPEIKAAYRAWYTAAQFQLGQLAVDMYLWGATLPGEFAAGIVNNLGVVHDAARQLAQTAAKPNTIESEPPDHGSALYGVTQWGKNYVQTFADGITSSLGVMESASRGLASAAVPGGLSGFSGASGASLDTVGAGGYHTHIHLTYSGDMPDDPEDLARLLREVAPFVDGRMRVTD
jgi:hypothetical protein